MGIGEKMRDVTDRETVLELARHVARVGRAHDRARLEAAIDDAERAAFAYLDDHPGDMLVMSALEMVAMFKAGLVALDPA